MNYNMQLLCQIADQTEQCLAALKAIQPKGGHFLNPSPTTSAEYNVLAQSLIQRAYQAENGLIEVVQEPPKHLLQAIGRA